MLDIRIEQEMARSSDSHFKPLSYPSIYSMDINTYRKSLWWLKAPLVPHLHNSRSFIHESQQAFVTVESNPCVEYDGNLR